jgi:tetratricopeptide (TPR) repeat protein
LAVLAIDAEHAEALSALERIYRVAGDAKRLAEVLADRAQLEFDVAQKKALHAEAARLYEGALADVTSAITAWRKVLDVDETDHDALDALARILEREGRYPELVELLEQKVRFEERPAEQVALQSRVAAIYAERLGDLERAVEAYRRLIDLAPDSIAALDALCELETRRQDWMAVQETLVRKLEAVGSGPAKIPVYRQLARLAVERHGSSDDAIGYLQEILNISPDEEGATNELLGLLEKTEKWHDLIEVLTAQADARAKAGDREGEITRLVRVADLWEGRLQSPESATEILERILHRDAENVRALLSLARIYENDHDVDRAQATLERAVGVARTREEAAELHVRIGRLLGDVHGEEAAEPHYLKALEAVPGHPAASEALEKVGRARGDWPLVANLLSHRIDRSSDPDRALLVELGRIYASELKQPAAALTFFERARKLAPDDPAVLEPLGDLYFAADRLDEALPLYQSLAEGFKKARRTRDLARLHVRIGAIAERRGDPRLALSEYTAAYQIDGAHTPTLAALGRIHMAESEWDKARKIYRNMLLTNIDPETGITKADVYLQLGQIHEKTGEGPKAIGMYERGLELDAGHAQLREALDRVKRA